MSGSCRSRFKPFTHIAFAHAAVLTLTALSMLISAPNRVTAEAAAGPGGERRISYVLTLPLEAAPTIQAQLRVPFVPDGVQLLLYRPHRPSERSQGVVEMEAYTESGRPLPIDKLSCGFAVYPDGEPFLVEYKLQLQPTFPRPSTWPVEEQPSLRWDDYAYIGKDALLQVRGFETYPVEIHVHLPDNWRLFDARTGLVLDDGPVHFEGADKVALLTGDALPVHHVSSAVGPLTFVGVGPLPWSLEMLAAALTEVLEPLHALELPTSPSTHNFIVARYPGVLRLNPLVSSQRAGDRTLLHWIGVGSIDWWRRHTIRDFIIVLAHETLNLGADATWFSIGLGEYGGLLLLFEAGLLSTDELYQNLHNMYVTGTRYTGPAWPALASASLAAPKSHADERVLQFRSPMTAFLLDAELRAVSDGAVSLLDWWTSLAAEQRQRPQTVLNSVQLLPTNYLFADWAAFAEEHIFGTRVTPLDFDSAFNRWYATLDR